MIRRRSPQIQFFCTFLGVAFFGCSLTPEYTPPEVEVPEEWRVPSDTSRSLADLAWWDLFHDDVLESLIVTALEENKDLRLAVARIEEARGALRATRSGQFPRVDLQASADRTQPSEVLVPGADARGDYYLAGALGWELDLWGELRAASEAARAELLAAENVRRGVIVSLVSDVALAYFELRDLDNRLEISKRTLGAREKALEIARLRFEGGITSEVEVQQTEVEVAKAESVVPDLQWQIDLKENELSILLGQNPGDIRRGLSLVEQPIPPEVPAGLPSDLLKRRPDIQEAEQNVIAANADVGIALAQFFPRFALTGAYGLQSDQFSDLWDGDAITWNFGLDMVGPIIDAGRNKGNLEAARARLTQAVIRYEQVVQQSFREVSDALSAYHQARKVRAAQEDLIDSSRAYLRLAVLQYSNGVLSYLDVLDAQRQLFDAELSRSQTIRNQIASVVLLYRALGGGWMPESDSPARVETTMNQQ